MTGPGRRWNGPAGSGPSGPAGVRPRGRSIELVDAIRCQCKTCSDLCPCDTAHSTRRCACCRAGLHDRSCDGE